MEQTKKASENMSDKTKDVSASTLDSMKEGYHECSEKLRHAGEVLKNKTISAEHTVERKVKGHWKHVGQREEDWRGEKTNGVGLEGLNSPSGSFVGYITNFFKQTMLTTQQFVHIFQ